MMVSAEYPTGLIWVTLSAVPRRGRLLAAKTAVFALVGLVVGEVLSFASFAVGQAVIAGSAPTASLGSPGVLRAVAGTGLFLAVIGTLGVAVGALVRSTTGGVAVMVALIFVLPGLGQVLPSSWRNPMLKFWPTQAGGQMLNVAHQAHALGPWAGLGLAGRLHRRRRGRPPRFASSRPTASRSGLGRGPWRPPGAAPRLPRCPVGWSCPLPSRRGSGPTPAARPEPRRPGPPLPGWLEPPSEVAPRAPGPGPRTWAYFASWA